MKDFIIILLFGWTGIHKFMQKKNKMGLLYLFTFGLFGLGWMFDIFVASFKIFNFSSLGLPSKETKNLIKISVVGEYYRKAEICSVVSGNKLYNLPDNVFIEKCEARRHVYRYKYRETAADLIPEPTNKHDRNAIKVMVDGVHVGYIPAELCVEVKKLLPHIKTVTAKIYGGDFKYHNGYEVFKSEADFSIDLLINKK